VRDLLGNANKKEPYLLMGYVAVVITSFLLGLFPTVSKPYISQTDPLVYASICSFAPFFVFTPLSLNASRKPQTKAAGENTGYRGRTFRIVLLSTFVGGIAGPIFYFFGLRSTAATDASVLANAEMVFTVVIASFAFRERLSRVGIVAITLVSVGVIVVATNLQFSSSVVNFADPGHILILLSSLCWATDNNIITYVSARIEVLKFVQYRATIAGPILILITFLATTFPRNAMFLGEIFVIGLVVFGGSLYFNTMALKWLGAIRSTLIFPISSLFGLLAAYVILHESIGFYQIISVVVIFIGIYLLTRTGSVRREYTYDLP
jgi:drug/metabolite transporter (DMT)-like permease